MREYVRSSPLNFVDPYGRDTQTLVKGVAAAGTALAVTPGVGAAAAAAGQATAIVITWPVALGVAAVVGAGIYLDHVVGEFLEEREKAKESAPTRERELTPEEQLDKALDDLEKLEAMYGDHTEDDPECDRKEYEEGKPGRKKQGREPREKKRNKPGKKWKPRNPPREPKKHTPSRKD